MSKLFGIHYTNTTNNGAGYEMAYCHSKSDALSVKPHLENENIIINEIVELDRSNYTDDQWNGAIEREMKRQGVI